MKFAESLKKIRLENELSQYELANMLGVAQSTVAMWESGRRTPKIGELQRLAKVLNVTAARLLGQKNVEITKTSIDVDRTKIDITRLDDADLEDIVSYINNLKSRKETPSVVPSLKAGVIMKKILIIDDEQETCKMLYSLLISHNYKVFLAFNGQMGLDYFEEVGPDIILLDSQLPDINVADVLKLIRKVSDIPVFITTARPQETAELRFSGLNTENFIEKPLSSLSVLNALKHSVGK